MLELAFEITLAPLSLFEEKKGFLRFYIPFLIPNAFLRVSFLVHYFLFSYLVPPKSATGAGLSHNSRTLLGQIMLFKICTGIVGDYVTRVTRHFT